MNILESGFTGVNVHYDNKPSELEENIAERTKWKRQRFDEIAIKEKMISSESFEKCFVYPSLSDMYKALNETTSSEENKPLVNTLHKKPYFSGSGISWKAQKDQLNITFTSTFWLKKRSCFLSTKSSKQKLFGSPKHDTFSNQ